MNSNDLDLRAERRTKWVVATVLIVVILSAVSVLGLIAKQFLEYPRKQALARIVADMAAVQAGEQEYYLASDELALAEFVAHVDSFQGIKPFSLSISYCDNVDAALQKIEHLDSIEGLTLAKCDVTDAGLKSLATMANLKRLSLYQIHFSDVGLDYLAECPKLESLEVLPRDSSRVSMAKLLTLPALKHLGLDDKYTEAWIEPNYEKLKLGTNLETLSIHQELPDEILAELRQALPNTKIVSGHHHKK